MAYIVKGRAATPYPAIMRRRILFKLVGLHPLSATADWLRPAERVLSFVNAPLVLYR
jgi:hypothetical protein